MVINSIYSEKQTAFIEYLLAFVEKGKNKLPSISAISRELGISTTNLREQIELARNLGLIHIKPRTGITILPYDFSPAVSKSLLYAVKSNRAYFDQYSDLRNEIEKSFFIEAAKKLSSTDIEELYSVIAQAKKKLNSIPVHIPHSEHKMYHLSIYKRLGNVFLDGLLRSYWEMYELIGLNLYADLAYLTKVWKYHEEIVDEIRKKDFEQAYQLLSEHIELIYSRT